jgi:hypothetical protein
MCGAFDQAQRQGGPACDGVVGRVLASNTAYSWFSHSPGAAFGRETGGMKRCVFCGSTDDLLSVEHAISRWAARAFDIQGWVTSYASDGPGSARVQVGRMQYMNVVLRDALCRKCNSAWLGGRGHIEDRVSQVLKPMAVSAQPAVLDGPAQALLAFWAVKTVFLVELAIRQMHPGMRSVEGYLASDVEFAWLREREEPPPRSMVWLGCWDCERQVPVAYEPSGAELPTTDGSPLAAHLTTFSVGFVVFQVYSVDFLAAEQHGAPVWNPRPPAPLDGSLARIWPPQLVVQEVSWPPPAFRRDEWHRLVTWDGVLRPGEQVGAPD